MLKKDQQNSSVNLVAIATLSYCLVENLVAGWNTFLKIFADLKAPAIEPLLSGY